MSRRFAKKIVDLYELEGLETNASARIRWVRDRGREPHFVLSIPFDFTVGRGGKVIGVEAVTETSANVFVTISLLDLARMINADKASEDVYFSFSEEQGELSDVVYFGVCLAQRYFYLSKNVLDVARRASCRCGYPPWVDLVRREAKGGQRAGVKKKERVMSDSEKERLENLVAGFDKIVENCIRHDWAEEYCCLRRDVDKYKGNQVLSRKKYLEEFTRLRREVLNKD